MAEYWCFTAELQDLNRQDKSLLRKLKSKRKKS